jgi:hypothetical protein
VANQWYVNEDDEPYPWTGTPDEQRAAYPNDSHTPYPTLQAAHDAIRRGDVWVQLASGHRYVNGVGGAHHKDCPGCAMGELGTLPMLERLHLRLALERERLGLSYTNASEQVGVSVGALHNLEQGGDPRLSTILAVLRWLHRLENPVAP